MPAVSPHHEKRVLIPLSMSAPAPVTDGVLLSTIHGLSMGTSWQVKLMLPTTLSPVFLELGIQTCLDKVVTEMSPWETDSAITRFNHAPAGTWQVLSPEFFEVLSYGLFIAEQTQGAYDPSIGQLANLWGFGCTGKVCAPPEVTQISDALKVTNWKLLEVRPEQRAVLQPGNVHLDLSSIAKGYAVDQVARYLRGLGISSFLVEVGGELRGLGTKEDGQPWWVELENKPLALTASTATNMVALHDLSIATSGDYLRSFEYQGQQYSHTIDPRSGYPIMHGLASVTVLHAQCMVADALATAMSVMGLEEGLRYANQLDVAALFLQRTANGLEEHMSLHFKRMTAE